MNVQPRTFETDYRTSNPRLHQLHVRWAIEDLTLATQAARDLFDLSRWPSTRWASKLMQDIKQSVLSDAAYWDAAALLYVHAEDEAYPADTDTSVDPDTPDEVNEAVKVLDEQFESISIWLKSGTLHTILGQHMKDKEAAELQSELLEAFREEFA